MEHHTVATGYRRILARDLFPAGRLPLRAQRLVVHGEYLPHDHDFWEAVLILGGHARHYSLSGDQELTAGDAFLMRPGTWHWYRACDGLVVYNCCFAARLVQRELAAILREPALHYLLFAGPLAAGKRGMLTLRLDPADRDRCSSLLDAISAPDTAAGGDAGYTLSEVERLGYLLLFLARMAGVARAQKGRASMSRAAAEGVHPAVLHLMCLLEEDMARAWTVPDLAERACIEPSYCSRLFRQGTGLSPMAYLARCRAERAASLLLRTRLPISQIAQQVGWPDQNHFARRFRAQFGMSATDYRRRFAAADAATPPV